MTDAPNSSSMHNASRNLPETQQGFALLLVLWTLVLISLIGTALLAGSKATTEQDAAETLLATTQAEADAAIQTALYHLLAGGAAHWGADGRFHAITEPDLTADVRIQVEAGKINPNTAPPGLLTAVFEVAGLQTPAAQTLARMTVLWRTPPSLAQQANRQANISLLATLGTCKPAAHPMHTLDDIGEIPGMTPNLLATLAPHISFTQKDMPSPHTRDPFMRAVFDRLQTQGGPPAIQGASTPQREQEDTAVDWAEHTLIVTARVIRPGGHMLIRQAVLASQPGRSTPFAFLSLGTIRQDQL
ncbi:hypothetical protein [Acetobacter cibinongensis]|uniref:General secretion pathway protein K n=1 Tax=Acetobacter cibinongensis TaxID=146475 RepID=A0A1Z5YVK8_9PROT|nr:hypothetical protein [Acetobacter cibinongensis]OUJ03012.1 hypothetical protein HK14_03710 [Acetobacter cibinongensis]